MKIESVALDMYVGNENHIYLSYSGGLDSTVLAHMLANYCVKAKKKLTLLNLNCMNLPHSQQKAEKIVIDKYRKYLDEEYVNICRFSHIDVSHNIYVSYDKSNIEFDADSIYRLPQQFLILSLLAANAASGSSLNLFAGYVKGDDFCNKSYQYKKYIKMVGELMRIDIKLSTPLLYVDKYEVYKYALKNNLLQFISYCEFPEIIDNKVVPCNKCHSCIDHNLAVRNYEFIYEGDKK